MQRHFYFITSVFKQKFVLYLVFGGSNDDMDDDELLKVNGSISF